MTHRRKFRPALESLEARDCPAFNVYFSGSTLNIVGRPNFTAVNPGDGVFLDLQPGGGLRFQEVGNSTTVNYGTYQVLKDLNLNLTFYNTNLTLDLHGQRLPGNATFNLGRGDINALTPNPITVRHGTIGGTLTFRGGSGLELIDLGTTGVAADALDVQGDVVAQMSPNQNVNDFFGVGDQINLNVGSLVRGNLLTYQVDSINVGEVGGTATVNKSVILNVIGSANAGDLNVFGLIGGDAIFSGSDALDLNGTGDTVEIGSAAGGPTAEVFGNVTANFRVGHSSLDIYPNGIDDGWLTMVTAANMNPSLDDEVTVAGSVFGNTTLTFLNNENNHVTFTGTILGNLTVTAFNGANDLSNFTGTLGGNLSLNLGNGGNTFVMNGFIEGSRVTIATGSGNDSIEINGANGFNLTANLGAGADTVTISDNNGVASACIDFGLDFDTDVWNPPPVIQFPVKLLHFP